MKKLDQYDRLTRRLKATRIFWAVWLPACTASATLSFVSHQSVVGAVWTGCGLVALYSLIRGIVAP